MPDAEHALVKRLDRPACFAGHNLCLGVLLEPELPDLQDKIVAILSYSLEQEAVKQVHRLPYRIRC